ncbi:MAG: hypothetical protein COA57_08715 [Flavobacteriales bacterium]|nr:MAG: hypothetical protein COA57_08715 [Flavobacteriales bacterium]
MQTDKLLGSYNWGIRTGGSLNSMDKIGLAIKAISMRLNRRFRMSREPIEFNLDKIKLPDSKLIALTLEYINDVHKEPLRNHCLRTFVIGDIFGQSDKLKYDKELYAISALLHDLGLEDNRCCLHTHIDCFAIEGAKEAGIFLKEHGLSDEKIKIVQDAIAFHLNLKIPKPLSEAYLLNKASATDTIGLYRHELCDTTATQITDKYPRLGFNEEVHQMLKKQCEIRPKSRISFLYSNGFGGLLKENRFDKKVL